MGSLSHMLKGSSDRISLCERAEINLMESKKICELEIHTRTEQLISHLEMSKKKLLYDLDQSCQKLIEELHNFSINNAENSDEKFQDLVENTNIKFAVANDIIDFSSCIGFVSQNNLLPSDLTLELATALLKVKTGGTILLNVCSNKDVSKQVFLTIFSSILHENSTGEVYRQKKIESLHQMKMRFKAMERGVYTISVKLYGFHITNSPMVIPVDDVPEELLAKVGLSLVPSKTDGPYTNEDLEISRKITNQMINNSSNSVDSFESKWKVGDKCLFKKFAELIECQVETVFRDCYDPINYLVKLKEQAIRVIVGEKDLIEMVKVESSETDVDSYVVNNNSHPTVELCSGSSLTATTSKLQPLPPTTPTHQPPPSFSIPPPPQLQYWSSSAPDPPSFQLPTIQTPASSSTVLTRSGNTVLSTDSTSSPYKRFFKFEGVPATTKYPFKSSVIEGTTISRTEGNSESASLIDKRKEDEEDKNSKCQDGDNKPSAFQDEDSNGNVESLPQIRACSCFVSGQKVIALREETASWEPAVIDRHIESASLYIVKYEDDGHFGGVSLDHLQHKWKVGETAIARWSEDNVWYNVQILMQITPISFKVKFIDYGNEDIVLCEAIVSSTSEIPDDSEVNEHVEVDANDVDDSKDSSIVKIHGDAKDLLSVNCRDEENFAKKVEYVPDDSLTAQDSLHESSELTGDSSGNCSDLNTAVILEHHEIIDMVSNASIDELTNSLEVHLNLQNNISNDDSKSLFQVSSNLHSDSELPADLPISNETTVKVPTNLPKVIDNTIETCNKLEKSPHQVPVSLQCCLCKKILKRAWRLSCDKTGVCWGCGVKEINKSHTCWSCHQPNISSSHLYQDDQLRAAVDSFLKTGVTSVNNVVKFVDVPEDVSNFPYDKFDISSYLSGEDNNPFENLVEGEDLFSMRVPDPTGLTTLPDGSLLICSESSNSVMKYSEHGEFSGRLQNSQNRDFPFLKPSDIVACTTGEVIVADRKGLHMFDSSLNFVKSLGENYIDECHGLYEDDHGRIVTINCNTKKSIACHMLTMPGSTTVFFIDKDQDKVVSMVDMQDVINRAIEDLKASYSSTELVLVSQCRNVVCKMGSIYVTDLGLDCVFVLSKNNDGFKIGQRGKGPGEFRDPTGILVDDVGNMIIVDCRNHRLQIINGEHSCIGFLKSSTAFARPMKVFMDHNSEEVFLSNRGSGSVVKFRVKKNPKYNTKFKP